MIARLVVGCAEQIGHSKREVTPALMLVEDEAAFTDPDGALESRRLAVPEPAIRFDYGKQAMGAGELRIG